MAPAGSSRRIGDLTFAEVSRDLKDTSILCLPLGAIEQHGPHLPLNTDVIVTEGFTRRIIERSGDEFDLWQLPTLPLGLSREHDWAPGTLSLSIDIFLSVLRNMAREITRSLPARNLAIINGHGGNRGLLESVLQELRGDFSLNACAVHPFDLCKAGVGATFDVHGGKSETSVMLALAPDLVRRELIGRAGHPPDQKLIHAVIFNRGTTWPWRTDDPRLTANGIIGDAHDASAEIGRAILDNVADEARAVFARLLENQTLMPGGGVR